MILLVIFFRPNPSNFTPEAAFSLSLICKIFLLSCWHVTSNKSGNETPLRIKHKCWYTRNKEGDSYHMGILHPKSSCPLRMTDVNKKHLPIMRVTLTPDSAVHDICILILGYTRFLRLLNGSFRFFLSWKSLISKKSRLLRNEILSQMCYFLVI